MPICQRKVMNYLKIYLYASSPLSFSLSTLISLLSMESIYPREYDILMWLVRYPTIKSNNWSATQHCSSASFNLSR